MFPTQILLRNLRSSPDLTGRIRDLSDKLALVHPRILNCSVAIELPAPDRRAGALPQPFAIEVRVRLPQADIVTPTQRDANVDTALRKAFALVRRQLREAVLDRPALAG